MQQIKQEQLNKPVHKRKLPLGVEFFISLFIIAAGAFCLMYVLKERGYYASGYDTWGHLFKSDLMYKNIREGNYYPLFTKLWYNGVQPYRYWAPLPYYLLAGLQMLAGGDIITTYYYFAGFSFFVGGLGWLLWGISTRRMALCTFLGFIWFFLPDNMRVFFFEGNVPRMVTAFLIPYLVYFIWLFVQKEKNYAAFFITLFTAITALTHLMISAMIGVAAFIFLVFHVIGTKKIRRSVEAIISMLLGYVVIGIWLVPSLVGGLVSMDSDASASVMRSLTYSIGSTLNPFTRIVGVTDTYYYGISIFFICVIGIMLADRKCKAGYFTNLIILLCTTPALIPILSKLPMNQLLWMMRFTTIAYAFFLWSLIEWKNARRYFTLLLVLFIVIDCIPSFMLSKYYFQAKGNIVDELKTSEKVTSQRVSLMDLSILNAYPSWDICSGDNPTQYTFGWAWQGAVTASNIVALNSALEKGNYEYLFDRSVELGDDTVIVLKQLVVKAHQTEAHLLKAAAASDYKLYSETNEAYIFHFNAPENFAVKSVYKGIGIGKYAGEIAYPYPVFTEGSDNIEDYTVKELSRYQIIYLSGFQYNDRKKAEKMVTKLANLGVRVVIDMSHIPVVKENKRMYFLGVVSQDIKFESEYPALNYKGNRIYTTSFPKEYNQWNTKYIEGVSHVLGTADYYGQKLTFAGTKKNQNIIFLGFNLLFYCMQTDDPQVYNVLSDCLSVGLHELPQRTIVPIRVNYGNNKIVIDTPQANVNTTIAFQDNFITDDKIIDQDNLMYVTKKHTVIRLVYPYLKPGIIVSTAGILGTIVWMFCIVAKNKKKDRKTLLGEE